MRRLLAASIAVLALMFGLTACTAAEPTVEVPASAIVIDVREADEYAAGHLENAELISLNSGQFSATLPSLDPDAEYYVYCRSGNRSAQAIAMMEQAGFTNVTNLGSVQEASSATGIPIVK